jgi:hypothetical protein
MRTNQVIERKKIFAERVCNIFLLAIYSRPKHEVLLQQREKDLFSDPRWTDLPVHAKEYLRGYWDAKMESLYLHNLEWRHWVPAHPAFLKNASLLNRDEVQLLSQNGWTSIYSAISEANPVKDIKSTYTWKGEPGKPF